MAPKTRRGLSAMASRCILRLSQYLKEPFRHGIGQVLDGLPQLVDAERFALYDGNSMEAGCQKDTQLTP